MKSVQWFADKYIKCDTDDDTEDEKIDDTDNETCIDTDDDRQ